MDYSGKKIAIVDPLTGEIRAAEIFVGVLGASGYTYAEATWTQTLPDWIGAHVRMFSSFGGVPRLIVPDNLNSGVNHASFYDPEIILDRLVHNAYRIELTGESMRKRRAPQNPETAQA